MYAITDSFVFTITTVLFLTEQNGVSCHECCYHGGSCKDFLLDHKLQQLYLVLFFMAGRSDSVGGLEPFQHQGEQVLCQQAGNQGI